MNDDFVDGNDFSSMPTGDDTPPAYNNIPEPAPSHWGRLTSNPRTACASYLAFVEKTAKARAETKKKYNTEDCKHGK